MEHNVYDEYGDVVCTKRLYNDRLLMWLLSRLKPERYGATAAERQQSAQPAEPIPPPELTLESSLRAMERQLPAPPEQLIGRDTLDHELSLADIADGALPHFLTEQRPPKTASREQAEARDKLQRKEGELSRREFADMCRHIDPAGAAERSGKRYR